MPSILKAESEILLQESDVEIEIIPQNPEPYQDVTINLISYSTDLNKAQITWQSGSNVILSGYGKTKYSFTTSGPNTTTVFDIKITPTDSLNSVTKKVLISPSEVEVLWEAVNSYTPPFYKGKAFLSKEGTVKVVAIPNTNVIKQGKGKVSYTWKLNDTTDQNASGYNKDSFIFKNSSLNTTEEVTVVASSVDDNYNAVKTFEIPTISPKIIFYKKSPTLGVLYSRALLNNTFLEEDELTIVAEPYYLDLKGNEFNFNYSWKINGESVVTPKKETELTIRPSSRGGYATIELTMQNLKTLFQEVNGYLKLSL